MGNIAYVILGIGGGLLLIIIAFVWRKRIEQQRAVSGRTTGKTSKETSSGQETVAAKKPPRHAPRRVTMNMAGLSADGPASSAAVQRSRAQNETASRPEASANMTSLAMLQAAMNNNSNSSQAPTQPTMTAQPQPAMTTQPAASMPNGMQMPQGAYYYPYMMPPMPMSGAGSPQVNGAQPPMMPNGQHMPFPMWMNPMFPPPGATPGQHAVSISMPSSPTRRNSPSAINNPGNYLSDSQMPPDRASTNRPQNRQSAAPPSYNDSIHHLLAD
ncbi:hypothetical protein H4S02_002837 [Coemansia sp. RSA 2611]|nr:hypothetical protein IWW54_003059 [Coemansia sp. RSA 2705]KAJ2318110.1 hypothetical protein IWW52_002749 [Coemansia sp. RSA 2704]KAJ2388502.1 hypothetical protein H4S02_002837 [Coemansia sp. RSA 2611]